MAILKINLMILSLLTLENIFNVDADPVTVCKKKIKDAFGETVTADLYIERILYAPNKRYLDLKSQEDHILYFIYIRQKADLSAVPTVLQFCNSYNEQQIKDACFFDLQDKNLDRKVTKEKAFELCYDNYDLSLVPEDTYFRTFFIAIVNNVRVKAGTKLPSKWCRDKYRL